MLHQHLGLGLKTAGRNGSLCLLLLLVTLFCVASGCGKYTQRKGGLLNSSAAPGLGMLSSGESPAEVANRRLPVTPQPPLPPALPTEPLVKPPQPDALAAGIPTLPDAESLAAAEPDLAHTQAPNTIPVPTPPILPAGAIALPDEPEAAVNTLQTTDATAPIEPEQILPRRRPQKPPVPLPQPPVPDVGNPELAKVAKLLDDSRKRYADMPDYECRLVKREVVAGKPLPQDEILYRFRQTPISVYMKVLSKEGQGREVMYVQGKYQNKIHILTGKGDNILVGVGFKTDMDPDSRAASAKSRYRIYEAGFGRTLQGLHKALNPTDGSKPNVRSLGLTTRPEYPYALEAVEVVITPGTDPLLPKGGKRQIFFDSKPDSPSYLMPVLVITESEGKEVEYYAFDQFKTPIGWSDSDWDPAKLGKK